MIPGQLKNILKGIGGEFELNRVVGFVGGMAYVVGAHAFLSYEIFWLKKAFDLSTYCLTFPPGLAIVAGGTALAVAVKDRHVASAKIIEQTGAVPAPPLDGPKVPVGDPPPVDKPSATEELPDYAR